jgi:two-component system, OmpR family, response regulator MprA
VNGGHGLVQDGDFQHSPAVLVVDDEPTIRETVASLLAEEGCRVRLAVDGLEAIEAIEAEAVDLIVSDVRMPRLDGVSLVQSLRRRGNRTPVVLISAVYAAADVDLPVTRFVPKPFDLEDLLDAVTALLCAVPQRR